MTATYHMHLNCTLTYYTRLNDLSGTKAFFLYWITIQAKVDLKLRRRIKYYLSSSDGICTTASTLDVIHEVTDIPGNNLIFLAPYEDCGELSLSNDR